MATITTEARGTSAVQTAPIGAPRKARPVVGWAVVGGAFLTIEVIALVGWVASGDFKRIPKGPTPVPGWMNLIIRSWEILGVFALAAFLYFVLIRPWKRAGRITTDGLLCLVFLTLFWQDSGLNYFQIWGTYNTHFINFGSWDRWILGWLSPNANQIAEPLVWLIPAYAYIVLGGAMVGCVVMRKAQERWPRMGTFGLVMVCLLFFWVWDFILETIFMRSGIYVLGGSIDWLTLFHGHFYQMPIYEPIMEGSWWAAFACIRYFRNDKGQTMAERGVDRLGVGAKKQTVIRFVALAGICNVGFLVYNLPGAFIGMYGSPWPKDITSRSYFMSDKICGEGSTYACSGPGIPIPRRESSHVSPDGTLVK
jgi:hypothetical protein